VEAELELGHDAEVAAAATERPEQVGVAILARPDDLGAGGDDRRREQGVDRQRLM